MQSENQFSFDVFEGFELSSERVDYKDIIVDRKSKYTVLAFKVAEVGEVKELFKELKKDSYFRKATHNTYAYRVKQESGSIVEGKNDDGEQGAGLCILRELQRENATGIMLIVTRYFGGIQLHGDRFRNVVDACQMFFEKEKTK